MSWHGYVPQEVHDEYGKDPAMLDIISRYGSLRKHEAGNEAIMALFGEIYALQVELEETKKSLDYQQEYFNTAISMLKSRESK